MFYYSILQILNHAPNATLFSKSKHMKTHTRPFKCPMNACTMGFATQRDLTRHEQSVHKVIGRSMAYCPHSGCKYFANGREDNLERHIKKKHRLETEFWYLGQSKHWFLCVYSVQISFLIQEILARTSSSWSQPVTILLSPIILQLIEPSGSDSFV